MDIKADQGVFRRLALQIRPLHFRKNSKIDDLIVKMKANQYPFKESGGMLAHTLEFVIQVIFIWVFKKQQGSKIFFVGTREEFYVQINLTISFPYVQY